MRRQMSSFWRRGGGQRARGPEAPDAAPRAGERPPADEATCAPVGDAGMRQISQACSSPFCTSRSAAELHLAQGHAQITRCPSAAARLRAGEVGDRQHLGGTRAAEVRAP